MTVTRVVDNVDFELRCESCERALASYEAVDDDRARFLVCSSCLPERR